MKKLFIYLLISVIITTIVSCAGFQVSSSVGFGIGYGVNSGPYGYGSYAYPNVTIGVYGGGYPRIRY